MSTLRSASTNLLASGQCLNLNFGILFVDFIFLAV